MGGRKKNPVSLVMVGIGGYGFYYLKSLFENYSEQEVDVRGVVDPRAEKSGLYDEITRRNISIFSSLEEFYLKEGKADLAIISSPIHFHIEQSCIALENGSNVLCDKPMGHLIQDAEKLIAARQTSGKWVMIGYQWSYSKAIQALKADIISGCFGEPLRFKSLCFWPRDLTYYERNEWAGKKIDEEGLWILDSPVANAMAHFIHNMFYLLGKENHLSAVPEQVQAECYRVYPIENYDTCACRIRTTGNTEMLFFGSHASKSLKGPVFHFEFEDASIDFGDHSEEIIATDRKGKCKNYGSPEDDDQFLKLHIAIEKVLNPDTPLYCGPEASWPQILCMNGIQESVPEASGFPLSISSTDKRESRKWVKDIDSVFYDCYLRSMLPHEVHLPWARQGKEVDLTDYNHFPGG